MLSGKLDTLSVTEVLTLLSRSRSSGALRIHGPEEAVVYCLEGAVTMASSYPGDRLADVLVRPGLLHAGEWEAATRTPDAGASLNETLAARGIDPARVQASIRLQTEESIFELSQWTEGDFGFDGGQGHPLSGLATFAVSDLLESLVDRMERWPQLLERLPGLDSAVIPVALLPSDDHDVTLTGAQLNVLRAVDGTRTVNQLARAGGDGIFHTAEVVIDLLEAGQVRFDGFETKAPAPRRTKAKPAAEPEPRPTKPAAPEPADAPTADVTDTGRGERSTGNGKHRVPVTAGALVDGEAVNDKPDRSLVLRLLAAVKELEVPEGGVK